MPPPDPARALRAALRRRQALAAALVLAASANGLLVALGGGAVPATASTERVAMALALAAVSSAGIAAAVRPSRCAAIVRRRAHRGPGPDGSAAGPCLGAPPVVAHHCSCGLFSSHVLRLRGPERCAGCTGMLVGGASGILVAVALGGGVFPSGAMLDAAIILLGATLSVADLFGRHREGGTAARHALASLALAIGLSLILAGLSALGLIAGIVGLGVALAVVGLRLEMSRLRHVAVYLGCPRYVGRRASSDVEPSS